MHDIVIRPADNGRRGRSVRLLVVAAMLALPLGSCSSIKETAGDVVDVINPMNWFGDDEKAKKEEEAEGLAKGKTGTKRRAKGYPDLASVPERPKRPSSAAQRRRLAEGLVADTRNARYTNRALREPGVGPPQAATSPPPSAAGLAPRPAREMKRSASAPSRFATPVGEPPAATLPPSPPAPLPSSGGVAGPTAAPGPSAPPVAPQSRVAAAPARKQIQVATIYFGDGSARLGRADIAILKTVSELYRQTGGRIRVVGHSSRRARTADPVRGQAINFRISLARANAVAEELIRHGVPRDRIEVVAQGDRMPLYAETSPTGEAGNRRAEIFLEYSEGS